MLLQLHMDMSVWGLSSGPRRSYVFQVSSSSVQGFRSPGVEICFFPLLWLLAFTTVFTTLKAVIGPRRSNRRQHCYIAVIGLLDVCRCVCRSVGLFVDHIREPRENGKSDPDAVCGMTREPRIK